MCTLLTVWCQAQLKHGTVLFGFVGQKSNWKSTRGKTAQYMVPTHVNEIGRLELGMGDGRLHLVIL